MDSNQTEVSIKFNNIIQNEKQLDEYVNKLKSVNGLVKGIQKSDLKDINAAIKETSSVSNKTSKNISNLFSIGKTTAFVRGLTKVVNKIGELTDKSSAYLENMNLLDVAFNNNTKEADKFVNKLSEMYGLDESWGYRTVGIFKQLANAMGLAAEIGDKLSTTLTQFSIDITSLYNLESETDAVNILTSALAG